MKYQFYILRGSFSDVYFNAREKGHWERIGLLDYLWLTIRGKMTKVKRIEK